MPPNPPSFLRRFAPSHSALRACDPISFVIILFKLHTLVKDPPDATAKYEMVVKNDEIDLPSRHVT